MRCWTRLPCRGRLALLRRAIIESSNLGRSPLYLKRSGSGGGWSRLLGLSSWPLGTRPLGLRARGSGRRLLAPQVAL
ncbi:MAG: hypothetical protein AAFX78_07490 [Cyanobacteria bacterium J06638_20]